MRVLLIDIDSKIPNSALMQISAWYKQQGDEVGFAVEDPDRVYVSCIFKKNAAQARGVATLYPNAKVDIGGTGVSLGKTLPTVMQKIKPDYDLYASTYSQGFTTRGCPRRCGFCVVHEKEGDIQQWMHPSQFHDPRFDTCMIMDNNLFAADPAWQSAVFQWFIKTRTKMLSPQGWDIRLLTPERAEMLRAVRHAGNLHFAWDNLADEKAVKEGIDLLRATGFNLKHDVQFYVLCGYNTILTDDIYRCETLKAWGTNAYVMPFRKTTELAALQRWANRKWLFWSMPYREYSRRPGA